MRAILARQASIVAAAVLGLAFAPRAAQAWGWQGHVMSARVAARKLPADMPKFFRDSVVELGYLCPEPDRWRDGDREPALRGAHHRDHTFRMEEWPPPLPRQRYDFYVQYIGKAKPGGGVYTWDDMAFAPYAIAERAEMLTVNFMLWRKAAGKTREERRVKRQIEQNIIHIAGVFGHFVTDTAMPIHNSTHGNGWKPHVPNPKGHTSAPGIHGRFEADFVGATIQERDFEGLVGPVRERGPWLEAALSHMQEAFAHVEALYELDRPHPWAAAGGTTEQERFASERLAHGAAALRDFWYSAWQKSATLPELRSNSQYAPFEPVRARGARRSP